MSAHPNCNPDLDGRSQICLGKFASAHIIWKPEMPIWNLLEDYRNGSHFPKFFRDLFRGGCVSVPGPIGCNH